MDENLAFFAALDFILGLQIIKHYKTSRINPHFPVLGSNTLQDAGLFLRRTTGSRLKPPSLVSGLLKERGRMRQDTISSQEITSTRIHASEEFR